MEKYITKENKIQESRTYSVADISAMLNISRASAYQLTGKGYFKVLRIGKRRSAYPKSPSTSGLKKPESDSLQSTVFRSRCFVFEVTDSFVECEYNRAKQ